jgi:flagellar biosynthesis protein FlhB
MIKQAISNAYPVKLVIECFKCIVSLIEVGPLAFMELWDAVNSFIQTSEHSVQKTLAFQTVIYFVQSGVFLDYLIKGG